MTTTALLAPLRSRAGTVRTLGLDDATVDRLGERFPELKAAAQAAAEVFPAILAEFGEIVDMDRPALEHSPSGHGLPIDRQTRCWMARGGDVTIGCHLPKQPAVKQKDHRIVCFA